jgi:hypothetical protein
MEQDILKSTWQGVTMETKGYGELQAMIKEKTHPVLKGIRKQLAIELIAFAVFLVVYYDFFDGDKKPLWANALLVTGMSFLVIYNMIGYLLTKRPLKGHNIIQSIADQINKLKTYAVVFMTSRTLAAICLLLFFSSVIPFNPVKYWILAGIVLTLMVQLGILASIWRGRLRQLQKIADSFSGD